MKKVIIMRHSKSSWDSSKISDIDRPLNERGLKDAPVMGDFLLKNNIIPDIIICSTAVRAKMTCDLVVKKLNRHIDIDYNPIIYDNNAREIIKLVAQTDDKINNLMIIGHNPSMHKIVEYLINNDFPYPKFSTSGVALINFNINKWASISDNYGLLEFFTTPKMLKAN